MPKVTLCRWWTKYRLVALAGGRVIDVPARRRANHAAQQAGTGARSAAQGHGISTEASRLTRRVNLPSRISALAAATSWMCCESSAGRLAPADQAAVALEKPTSAKEAREMGRIRTGGNRIIRRREAGS